MNAHFIPLLDEYGKVLLVGDEKASLKNFTEEFANKINTKEKCTLENFETILEEVKTLAEKGHLVYAGYPEAIYPITKALIQ